MTKKKLSCGEAEDGSAKRTAAERVFDAARELFYQRGVRAVGVDEIVSQAGVTKPSLYRAFPSKDDLVAACLKQTAAEERAVMDALLAQTPDDPRAQLHALVRRYAAKLEQPGFRGCSLSNTAVEFPEPDHASRAVLVSCKSELRARIGELTRRLGVSEPEALADGLLLIIEGGMASHHIFGSQGPSVSMVAAANALIDAYVKAMPAQSAAVRSRLGSRAPRRGLSAA